MTDLLTATGKDGRDLLEAAASEWTRPVPHCPGWDAAQLVGHMGGIFAWIAQIVTTGEPVARQDRETPPAETDRLAPWYLRHLDRTLTVLTATPPGTPAWTFSSRGIRQAGWWRRRLAVETAIHRWDAQHAMRPGSLVPPPPIAGEVSAAGIDEFLDEFLPGLLAQPGVEGLTGLLRLHAADSGRDRLVDLDAQGDLLAASDRAGAGTTVVGTASDLLLWLTNRRPPGALQVSGRADVAGLWHQLRR